MRCPQANLDAQQPDHVAVAEVKLHRLITGLRG